MRATYINGNVNLDTLVLLPGVGAFVPLLGGVGSRNEGVLGQLLVEALLRRTVNKEVQGLRGRGQGQDGEKRPHGGQGRIASRSGAVSGGFSFEVCDAFEFDTERQAGRESAVSCDKKTTGRFGGYLASWLG